MSTKTQDPYRLGIRRDVPVSDAVAELCPHAGASMACRPCRILAHAAARDALEELAAWHDRRARYARANAGTLAQDWQAVEEAERATAVRQFRDRTYPQEQP